MRKPARRHLVRTSLIALATVVVAGAAAFGAGDHGATTAATARRTTLTRALARYLRTNRLGPIVRVPGHSVRTASGLNNLSSTNWAGYADDNSTGHTYTMVSGTWNQPTVTCPSDENRLVVWWVGLDGFNTGTVEQDGTGAFCSNGTALYFTWWEMYPTNSITIASNALAPADHIVSTVNFTSGQYVLTVKDSTHTAASFTTKQTCTAGCSNASAEWIAETPQEYRGQTPWPKYTMWKETTAKVKSGATTGTISSFPDDEITIVGSDFSTTLGTTGALTNLGKNFNVSWRYAWA